MSHISTIDLHVTDLEALAAGCVELGLELVQQPTYHWFGTTSVAPPEGFTRDDLGKCEYAIRIPGDERAYEVGVVTRRDGKPGYMLLWDEFVGGYGMEAKIGKGAGLLKQQYAAQKSMAEARKQGFRVQQKRLPNGKLQVICSK
jgi:hypothetical protein